MFRKILNGIRTIYRVLGAYRWHAVLLIGLGFVSGALEVIGIGMLIPLFTYAIQKGTIGTDSFSRIVQWVFETLHLDIGVRMLLILIVGMFIGKAMIMLAFSYVKVWVVASYECTVRSSLYAKMLRTQWSYLLNQKIGYVENLLMTDLGIVVSLLKHFSALILVFTGLLLYSITAFSISPFITGIMLGVGSVVFFLSQPLIRRTRELATQQTRINKLIAHFVNEHVMGLKQIKAFVVESPVSKAANQYFLRLKKNRIALFFLRDIINVLNAPISVIFICTMFAVSYVRSDFNFAVFIATVYLVNRMFDYLEKLQGSFQQIMEAVPAVQNILGFWKETDLHHEPFVGDTPFSFEKDIRFSKVSFAYANARGVLADVDLTIRKGEMIGIVGPSGAGKTTIVDLLLRLFVPSTGVILVDGKDIHSLRLDDWRAHVGYVSQEIFLQNDTIAANISFYQTLDQNEIEAAAKKANIHDDILRLPRGYQSVIGERGNLLSGGQRQRLVLARVLARHPRILILDEATSSLDNESEVAIQRAIEQLKGEITVIAIAHRLSTVMSSDTLFVIEKGRVIEQGPPKELLADSTSAFYKLVNVRN